MPFNEPLNRSQVLAYPAPVRFNVRTASVQQTSADTVRGYTRKDNKDKGRLPS